MTLLSYKFIGILRSIEKIDSYNILFDVYDVFNTSLHIIYKSLHPQKTVDT